MTRRNITLICIAILIVGLIAGGIISCKGTPEEATEEEPTITIPLPEEEVEELAQKIRSGEIDVGTEHGLGLGQRYHRIHATVLELECVTCHISEADTTQTVFNAQDVSAAAPGPVDKRVCLACHRAGPRVLNANAF